MSENMNWEEADDEALEDGCMDEDPGAIEEYYVRQLKIVRGERDAALAELERIKRNLGMDTTPAFCPHPGCPSNNPRT